MTEDVIYSTDCVQISNPYVVLKIKCLKENTDVLKASRVRSLACVFSKLSVGRVSC